MKRIAKHPCRAALAASLFLATPELSAVAESAAVETARRLNQAFIEVADRVSPSVVVIEVAHRPDYQDAEENENPLLETLPPDLRRRFQEHSQKKLPDSPSRRTREVFDSRGSGFVLRQDGWILTNDHVIEGAAKVRVRLKDGRSFEPAGTWWSDPQSDLAVIKIEVNDLVPAKLADSTKTRVGEFAIAIGAPFDLDYSITFGHVSAKGRNHVIPNWSANLQSASMDQDFIQTDASINPGNSGGPLVNIDGEVIGVNTLIRGLNRGIGFAIPSNLAKQVADQLIADGKFTRAWLGLQIGALRDDGDVRELLPGINDGVVVRKILPNGPASKSGLRPADVITAVEGAPVATAQQLRNEIRARKIGSSLALDVARPDKDGKVDTLQVKLRTEPWPDAETNRSVHPTTRNEGSAPFGLGLTVQTLTKALAEKFGVDLVPGVVVTDVQSDSPAFEQRIRPGDIITEVNRQPVTTPKQFRDALPRTPKKGVLIQLLSDGAPEFRILKDSGD